MAGRDAHLLGAPAVLPEREDFLTLWGLLHVVVTGDVAEAEEDVRKPVLWVSVMEFRHGGSDLR